MIYLSNGGPHIHGNVPYHVVFLCFTKDGKCSNLITSEFHHISSPLPIRVDVPNMVRPPFLFKIQKKAIFIRLVWV